MDFDIYAVQIDSEFIVLAEHQADSFGFEDAADRVPFVRWTALRLQNEAANR